MRSSSTKPILLGLLLLISLPSCAVDLDFAEQLGPAAPQPSPPLVLPPVLEPELFNLTLSAVSFVPYELGLLISWLNPADPLRPIAQFNLSLGVYAEPFNGTLLARQSQIFDYTGNGLSQFMDYGGLQPEFFYELRVQALYAGKPVSHWLPLTSQRLVVGLNYDGDELPDRLDPDDDNDQVPDWLDLLPQDPTQVGDYDGDGVATFRDVDADGDGLIELYNVELLNLVRYDLTGASLVGNTEGCGGGLSADGMLITACFGYELIADLDLHNLGTAAGRANWQPLGGDCDFSRCRETENYFAAVFEGNNYTISNVRMQLDTDIRAVGFFGMAAGGADLRNLHLRMVSLELAADLEDVRYVGGLVGFAREINIQHSSVQQAELALISGNLSRISSDIGGLVGRGERVNISSSWVQADLISGDSDVAGLAGQLRESQLHSCWVQANKIVSSIAAAGLGANANNMLISNSNVTLGELISHNYTAGGLSSDMRDSQVSFVQVTAQRISGGDYTAGLIGDAENTRISAAAVALAELSGNDYVGGLVGGSREGEISAAEVILGRLQGNNNLGGLVGDASSSLVASFVRVTARQINGKTRVGGLIGDARGEVAVNATEVEVSTLSGTENIGGLIGEADTVTIVLALVLLEEISGNQRIGGIIGRGNYIRLLGTAAVVQQLSGNSTGGLLGSGVFPEVQASLALTGNITGTSYLGGLFGRVYSPRVSTSYAVTAAISGAEYLGPFAAFAFRDGLGGLSYPQVNTSYTDARVLYTGTASPLAENNLSLQQTTAELQGVTDFSGIYAAWAEIWCNPETAHYTTAAKAGTAHLRLWNLGTEEEYPVLNCLPFTQPEQQRRRIAELLN